MNIGIKIITLVLIYAFMAMSLAYPGVNALRVPMILSSENDADIISNKEEEKLIHILSSDDTDDVDKGLKAIDALRDPEQVVRIIENVFAGKNLRLELDIKNQKTKYVKIIDIKSKLPVGQRDFDVHADIKRLTCHGGYLSDNELRGKRLFPIMYRWVTAHPYMRGNFSGWAIRTINVTYSAARSWWRSGFDSIEIINSKTGDHIKRIEEITPGERFDINCRFPEWSSSEAKLYNYTDGREIVGSI